VKEEEEEFPPKMDQDHLDDQQKRKINELLHPNRGAFTTTFEELGITPLIKTLLKIRTRKT